MSSVQPIVELFSEKSLNHASPDILGDAYEWILKYFAPQKAKEKEVYTAREVIKLMVEILGPRPGEWEELQTIEKEILVIEDKIEGYLRELK